MAQALQTRLRLSCLNTALLCAGVRVSLPAGEKSAKYYVLNTCRRMFFKKYIIHITCK